MLLAAMQHHSGSWSDLRARAEAFGRAAEPVSDWYAAMSAVAARQWEVGRAWAKRWNVTAHWLLDWVCPTIPERWVLPSLPPRHERLRHEIGVQTAWRFPDWLPQDFRTAWGFEPPYDVACEPWQNNELLHTRALSQFHNTDGDAKSWPLVDHDKTLHSWSEDERPPNPLGGETREAFHDRMDRAWVRRALLLKEDGYDPHRTSRKRKLYSDAILFVMYRVCGLSLTDVMVLTANTDATCDESTVRTAVERFATLIEIEDRK
jgi:hypothetical protein